MSHRSIYWLIGGFVLGVLWRSFFDVNGAVPAFLAVLASALIVAAFFSSQKKFVLIVALALFAASFGMVRYDVSLPTPNLTLEQEVGTTAVVEGTIIDEPDVRDTYVGLTVRPSKSEVSVLVFAPLAPRYKYGDTIRIRGKLEKPKVIEARDERLFDYLAYLAKDNIYYTMRYPVIELVSEDGGNVVIRNLFALKHAFLERLARVIPEPEVSLLGGLVVGAKQSLGKELVDEFRAAGVVHVVVLSGYNISIVAEFIMRMLSFLPTMFGIALGAVGVVLFALLTGAASSVVRASIMALIVLLARATGRTYDMTRALLLAGTLMVFHNPRILVWDMSFQLSFLATLGLIVIAPLLAKKFQMIPTKGMLREILVATISTQIIVLPLLLYSMGTFSLVALVTNLLILPLIPCTMLIGFLTGIIAFLSAPLSLPFALLSTLLLRVELMIVHLCANVPFAQIGLPHFPWWLALFMYVGLGMVLFFFYNKEKQ